MAASEYQTRQIGVSCISTFEVELRHSTDLQAANTLEHRVFIEQNGKVVSPFQYVQLPYSARSQLMNSDIPLFADESKTVLNSMS